jgi:hypothetical protein
MKINPTVSKILTNKWVLNIVALLALLNVIGYMVMGNLNNVLFFIVLAVLVRYFSKNMIIVLGVPLIVVNLFSLKENSYYHIEGMENNSDSKQNHSDTIKKINDESNKKQSPVMPGTEMEHTEPNSVGASNVKTDEHFEVGRAKNGQSKIDYAATIENAYDELNKILGSDGIKSLTDDTQRLMKQQMELANSMKGLAPLVEKMMPMAQQMQGMMNNMGEGSGGLNNIMEMAQKMAKGLGSANKTA